MRKFISFYKMLSLAVLACMSACSDDDNIDNSDFFAATETMELRPSSTNIELDGNNLNDVVLTFEWTKARQMPDEYVISYITKLDIEGNDFASCVRTEEEEGVFSRSYTTEQLQKLLVEKWGRTYTKPATLQFRVLAKWDGGSRYVMPEVRTISVDVRPYKPIVFDADKVFLEGNAIGEQQVQMTRTLENEHLYAALLDLKPGLLKIPVEFDGEINYVSPEGESDVTLSDDKVDTLTVAMRKPAAAIGWKITETGEHRVVVNMEAKTVAIYPPSKKLEPLTIDWIYNGAETGDIRTTTVTNLWLHGPINSWGTPIDGNFTASLADPQVLVRKGVALSGDAKFIIESASPNNVYAFGPVLNNGASITRTLVHGVYSDMSGSASRAQRDSNFKIPGNTTLIALDLRNKKILVNK